MNDLSLSLVALVISCFSFFLCFLINKETSQIRELDKKALRVKLDMYKYFLDSLDAINKKLDDLSSSK